MTAIKESSTIQENKRFVFDECPIAYAMDRIGGYWKPIILYHLLGGSKRYSEIRKCIPTITEKMLIQHLKQLENDQLIIREAKPIVPPHVTYSLTASGKALRPVLYALAEWVVEDSKITAKRISKDLKDFPVSV
ncbi:winged helix-turn-helix transcriptional regulator [Taibaiella koreensis]|uniref:winged helix-turn-helix transcriptional regulator n=1 Tax=Taibaiella koreensis TaxID=1268548 RepID=UPI000E59D9B9|nr:helix-turn-helix domain-containing protein [Taibaiella koreensis]